MSALELGVNPEQESLAAPLGFAGEIVSVTTVTSILCDTSGSAEESNNLIDL
jgi:hypothetical protein